jgi:hypothetical protein
MGSITGGPERTESKGFYEMLWDCDHCEQKALLGKSQRHCPNCGAPQNPDKRYFPKEGEAVKVEGHKFEGSDRHCPACNAPMGIQGTNCTQCGSPMDGSKEVKGIASVVKPKMVVPSSRGWLKVLVVILAIGVVIWFLFFRKKDATLTLAGHKWERTIALEKFGDWPDEAWRKDVPADASMPTCVQKEREKKRVDDGEECHDEKVDRKDGTFEVVKKCKTKYRWDPVMDDWCTFTRRTWKKSDEAKLTGTGMDAKWPDKVPAANVAPALGAIRGGARKETLILDFGKSGTCDVSDAIWRKYKDGDKVKAQVRARSGDIVCDSL